MSKSPLVLTVLAAMFFLSLGQALATATRVNLFTADGFAVLSGAGITNTGATTITGDVGTYPTTTQTGFGSVTITGTNHTGDAVTQGAKTDLVTAYDNAAGQGPTTPIVADLGGQTLNPGVYNSGSSIGLTGTVTLDAAGDKNAVFIFQAGSTLTTASSSRVSLINGAQECNVFWQIGSSATLGTSTSFVGNIMALTSITLNSGATVIGRVLARNGAVTLDTNTITKATCEAGTDGGSARVFSATTGIPAAANPPYRFCPALASGIIAPTIIDSRRVDVDSIYLSWGPYSGTDKFNVRYGPTNGDWRYNVDVTGFNTTINDLPVNQPIWVQVSARNECMLGSYGGAKFTGSPKLPNAGFAPNSNNFFWEIFTLIQKSFFFWI